MGGEIAINVDHLAHTDDFVKPITGKNYGHDLSMVTKDGEYLHICGKNDWGYLALEIIKPINQAYDNIYHQICVRCNDKSKKRPSAALLGDAEWRIVDIVEKMRENNDKQYVIYGVTLLHNEGVETGIAYLMEETAPGRANEYLDF